MQAQLSRLGSRLSFGEAASELRHLKGVTVAAATARRRTEADGAIYAALEEAAAARVLRAAPPAPAGPPVQQMSVDGAMVGLVDGSWREVRTLAIGTVRSGRAPGTVRCTEVSLAEAATCIELAAGEVHHRGGEPLGSWLVLSMGRRGARPSARPIARMPCASSTSRMPPSA